MLQLAATMVGIESNSEMVQSAARVLAQPLALPVLTRFPEAEVLASESGELGNERG